MKIRHEVNLKLISERMGVPHKGPDVDVDWYECEPIGPKVSEERKEELRESMKGNTYRKGKNLSEAHKEAIRQANLNRDYPRWSDESKKRLSDAKKGNNNRGKRCVYEGVEYKSVAEASRILGIPKSTLHRKVSLLQ